MIYEEIVVLDRPFSDVLSDVKATFAAEGFGTLTEVDMQATLKAKIDKEISPFVIVGVCNPRLASRALDAEPQIGVLLPCNVVVRQVADGVAVEVMDPGLMASITGNADVGPIADEARALVNNALVGLASGPKLVGRDE